MNNFSDISCWEQVTFDEMVMIYVLINKKKKEKRKVYSLCTIPTQLVGFLWC